MINNPRLLALPLAAALVLSGGLTACAKDTPAAAPGSSSMPATTPDDSTSPDGSESPASSDPSTSESPDASSTPSDASATPSNRSSAAAELGSPVGKKSLRMGTDAFTLTIYAPQRQDQTVTLTFDLSIDATTDHVVDARVLSSADSAFSRAGGVPNGFALVDTAGQKMYLPATTGDGMDSALCTPGIPSNVEKGEVYTFSCVFAGVPQNLSTVTVRSDSFGNFGNVAIR